ncbi:L-ascorbate metabolism protein UlaG (beta-lactamase superfamily) [Kitasatospora sp. MAP12-15]|uniref:MBL fold metallo-hydrolase n=1 Tax=unclassified Kitasatospora TaxID=2633591 RepID=UPI002474E3F7|nr:MBL fold metallo-hydrolase [Kitasatospora sp. MAP12-44]MDH6109045.1 L-ascorbate metabolism protein UlaG (beta-lactamase superfamily) [Kitasatospora sp. MAP12-44]
MSRFAVQYIGGPSAVLEIGGLRLLTDPTFDPPGEYPIGARVLVKNAGPALTADQVGAVDAVLLSHDQHPDNLDRAGRDYLAGAAVVLSTASAQQRLGGAVRALANWESVELPRPDGGLLRVTGVPAQHGPDGSEHLVGEVTGFVLTGEGLPSVYVSGDNASLAVVQRIADRLGPVDIALLFAGAARTPVADGPLTLTSEHAATAAGILGASQVIPLHFEHWGHFTEGADTLLKAFEQTATTAQLHLPRPGDRLEL